MKKEGDVECKGIETIAGVEWSAGGDGAPT